MKRLAVPGSDATEKVGMALKGLELCRWSSFGSFKRLAWCLARR